MPIHNQSPRALALMSCTPIERSPAPQGPCAGLRQGSSDKGSNRASQMRDFTIVNQQEKPRTREREKVYIYIYISHGKRRTRGRKERDASNGGGGTGTLVLRYAWMDREGISPNYSSSGQRPAARTNSEYYTGVTDVRGPDRQSGRSRDENALPYTTRLFLPLSSLAFLSSPRTTTMSLQALRNASTSALSTGKHKVVVVGAGSAGLSVANQLWNRLRGEVGEMAEGEVAVVDVSESESARRGEAGRGEASCEEKSESDDAKSRWSENDAARRWGTSCGERANRRVARRGER